MQRAIIIITLILLSFGLKAQVYQSMPQPGYGPVKRFLTDSVLTIPQGINSLRNITGGRDAGQIRWNATDSGFYVYSGYQWIKINIDSVSLSNRINSKLNISDTASMLSAYMRKTDTLSLSNRINLRVKYSDTAAMLLPYLRKLDTASLSNRINRKMDSLILTTIGTGGLATLLGTTLNIPNYGGALVGYVPYSGATNNVTLGSYNLTGTLLNADNSLQVKNAGGSFGNSTKDYTAITSSNGGFNFFTNWMVGATTFTKGAAFVYPTSGTTYQYRLPVRDGTLALVEDTVSLSNRINLKLNSSDTSSLSNRINLRVKYSDTASMLAPYLKAAVTSVGLTMPVAFNVSNSPITSTGTIAVTGAGTAAQYIRGDGQLATLPPSGTGGGSSVNYYLNGGTSQGTISGSTYYQMSKNAAIGSSVDFTRLNSSGDGLIAQFITDVADPNRLEIPAGAWNFELYFSASSAGGAPAYYVELLKYNGSGFTTIATNSAITEVITGGTAKDLYLSSLAVPYTTLTVTDRLVVRVYVITSGKNITLYTQNGNLCQITTTFAAGMSSLNGLTANTQYLAVDTLGSDFNINSLTDTHTFNLPSASATKRGALKSADWSTFNGKMNYSDTVSLSNRINTKLNSSDTASLSNRINLKLNISDTASMLSSYQTAINSRLKISDTSSMLSVYLRKADTSSLSNRINAKQNTITLTTTGTSGAATFSSSTLNIPQYQAAGTYVTSVTGNSPIVSSGGTTPAISIPVATSSANGYLSLTDWTTFNNKSNTSGTVTSVATGLGLSGGTITTSGTLLVDTASASILSRQRAANTYYLSTNPNGYSSINGTGFVKASGTTISYDNSTYLTTSSASSTYVPYTGATGNVNLGTNNISSFSSNLMKNGSSGGALNIQSIGSTNIAGAGYVSVSSQDTSTLNINYNGITKMAALNGSLLTASRTFTFPNSSGTFALTSQLSGYLPLTGGTLTGALGGTSASFSSSVTTNANLGITINPSSGTSYQAYQIGSTNYLYTGVAGNTDGIITGAATGDAVFRSVSGKLLFSANNGASANLSIATSGNVGIGTTIDAGYKLDVNGTVRTANLYFSTASARIFSGTTDFAINNSGNTVNMLLFNNSTGAATFASSVADWGMVVNNTVGTNGQGLLVSVSNPNTSYGSFQVQHSGSGAAFIVKGNGNVGIGTNSPSGKLHITAIDATSSNNSIYVENSASTVLLRIRNDGAFFTGTASSSPYNNTSTNLANLIVTSAGSLERSTASSRRFKENITNWNDNGLNTILALNPVTFTYKAEYYKNPNLVMLGLIAEDVAEVSPYLADYENEDRTGKVENVRYATIVVPLIKAVQELSAQIEILKSKIQTLENK